MQAAALGSLKDDMGAMHDVRDELYVPFADAS
jgi:hypothetical protein